MHNNWRIVYLFFFNKKNTNKNIKTKIKTRIKTVPAKTLQKKTAVPTIRSGE